MINGHDPLSTLRAELTRRREALGLNFTDAAKRAGISGPRWSTLERGYELKGGKRIEANPSRRNLIKMARAVEWSPSEALTLAGMSPLTIVESRRTGINPGEELAQLIPSLSEARVRALLHVARAMDDPQALIPDDPDAPAPDQGTVHREMPVETPQEPVGDPESAHEEDGLSR